MEKLFEIVEAHLPDEQKDDIKSKIDGAVSSLIEENSKTLKKDLSSKYGVNFFEEDVNKAFDNKSFIKREMYEALETTHKGLLEELEKYKKDVESFNQERISHEASIELLSQGLKPERLSGIKPLLEGEGTVEEKVNKIKTELPELFVSEVEERKHSPKSDDSKVLTEAEKYFQQRKKQIR